MDTLRFRRGSRQRCPYCHDALSDPVRMCPDCGAVLHTACMSEHGGCTCVPMPKAKGTDEKDLPVRLPKQKEPLDLSTLDDLLEEHQDGFELVRDFQSDHFTPVYEAITQLGNDVSLYRIGERKLRSKATWHTFELLGMGALGGALAARIFPELEGLGILLGTMISASPGFAAAIHRTCQADRASPQCIYGHLREDVSRLQEELGKFYQHTYTRVLDLIFEHRGFRDTCLASPVSMSPERFEELRGSRKSLKAFYEAVKDKELHFDYA